MTIGLVQLFATAAVVSGVTVLPPKAARIDLGAVLLCLEERPLESWPSEDKAYRFIWLPPFDFRRLISVRVQQTKAGATFFAKAANRKGGVSVRFQRRLSADEWQGLTEARQDGFWRFHPQDYPQLFSDGATWILEGAASGERLRIVQHVPAPGPFVDLCRKMLVLTGIGLRDNEVSLLVP